MRTKPSIFFKTCWKYLIPLLYVVGQQYDFKISIDLGSFFNWINLSWICKTSLLELYLCPIDYKHCGSVAGTFTLTVRMHWDGWWHFFIVMVPLLAAGQMCLTAGTFRQVAFLLMFYIAYSNRSKLSKRWYKMFHAVDHSSHLLTSLCRLADDSRRKQLEKTEQQLNWNFCTDNLVWPQSQTDATYCHRFYERGEYMSRLSLCTVYFCIFIKYTVWK